MNKQEFTPAQLHGLYHGSLSILLGLISGIILIFSVLHEVAIWPGVSFPFTLPGDVSTWRGAHAGALLNGVMCLLMVFLVGKLTNDEKAIGRISYALVLMVWGNGIFYIARAWGATRGLAVVSEKYGSGNIFDMISILAASTAMLTTFYAVIYFLILIRQKLKSN